MSVINQMLKDLDQRKAKAPLEQPVAQPALVLRRRSPLWLIVILFGAFLVFGLWLWQGSSNQPLAPMVLLQAESQPASTSEHGPVSAMSAAGTQPHDTDAAQPIETEQLQDKSVLPNDQGVQQLAAESVQITSPAPKEVLAEQEPPTVQPEAANAAAEAAAKVQSQLRVERVELSVAEQQQRLRQQALQAEQAGRVAEARAYWQQLQALAPHQSEPYVALAKMAQQAGYETGSQYWLQLGLEQGADVSRLAPLLAASYARQQLWQQVLQMLELVPASGMQSFELAMRATAWQQLDQHQAALTAFEQLARLEPLQGRWWLGMAISSDALGQRQQAANQFQRSLQLGEDLTPASKDYIRQRLQELN